MRRAQNMDERVLTGMADLLLRQLGAVFEDGVLPANTQVVVRPIFTWPEGKPGVWVMVNWPN